MSCHFTRDLYIFKLLPGDLRPLFNHFGRSVVMVWSADVSPYELWKALQGDLDVLPCLAVSPVTQTPDSFHVINKPVSDTSKAGNLTTSGSAG